MVAELTKITIKQRSPWIENFGISLIVFAFLILGSLWARIIWVYIDLVGPFLALPILADIGVGGLFLFLGLTLLGPDKNKLKNSIHSAKYLNAYYDKHRGDVEQALTTFGYRIRWEIKYTVQDNEEIKFEGGRNKKTRNKKYSSSGFFEVEKGP